MEETEVAKIKGKIQELRPGGRIDILAGLEKAVEELDKTARSYRQSSHTLVLLTNGGSGMMLNVYQLSISVSCQTIQDFSRSEL